MRNEKICFVDERVFPVREAFFMHKIYGKIFAPAALTLWGKTYAMSACPYFFGKNCKNPQGGVIFIPVYDDIYNEN